MMKFGVSTQRCEHCAVAMRVDFQVVDVLLVKLSRRVCHARIMGEMGAQILVWASEKGAVCLPHEI